MGASRRVPGCTPGCLRTAGAPTQAAEGRRAEAPSRAAHGADSPPASRAQLPAPSSPRPPRSPLRSSPRGDGKLRRDRPDPLALTSLLRSSSSRECLLAAVPGGTQGSAGHGGRGTPSLRRGYLGWIEPGAAAAAAGAAGPPPSGPRQGRSANSQPWRGRARRVHTRPAHTAETLLGGSADQGEGSGFKFFLPSPPDLTNFSPLLGSQLSKAGIPAGDVRQTPRPPRGALSQFGTPQPLRGRLQTTNPVGEDFTNLSIPQPEGSKGDTSRPQILFKQGQGQMCKC